MCPVFPQQQTSLGSLGASAYLARSGDVEFDALYQMVLTAIPQKWTTGVGSSP